MPSVWNSLPTSVQNLPTLLESKAFLFKINAQGSKLVPKMRNTRTKIKGLILSSLDRPFYRDYMCVYMCKCA